MPFHTIIRAVRIRDPGHRHTTPEEREAALVRAG
jgi:hypothetical protein